jgi:O-antigen ligase
MTAPPASTVERVAFASILGLVAVVSFSIAAAGVLLAAAILGWLLVAATGRKRMAWPAIAWPLAAYAAWTLVAVVFSLDPGASLLDQRELLIFLLVPAVHRLARGDRALTVLDVLISVGALSAVVGIVQYGILSYDTLGRRPQGTLGHYMTYSGTLMLVLGAAVARVLFRKENRTWPALVIPALAVALAFTFSRNAWVGACVAVGLLFIMKDWRLLGLLPVVAATFFALAPASVTARVYSMFDRNDPTSRDRIAMLEAGVQIVRDHPLAGIGPDMVIRVYPEYRAPDAVEPIQPHLHNVPLQIAAERGLPALAAWIWFLAILGRDLWRQLRQGPYVSLAAAGLAALASMLAAGLFEYNFGDSEFLIPFLVLATLPYAAAAEPDPPMAPSGS